MKHDLITIPAAQEMFRGRMRLQIINLAWRLWSAPPMLCLYNAPNAPSPLNCHAGAFASWPQPGPSGGCSWLAKGKIVRQASDIPTFQRGRGVLLPIIVCRANFVCLLLLSYCAKCSSGASETQQDRAGPYRAGSTVQRCLRVQGQRTPQSRAMVSLSACPLAEKSRTTSYKAELFHSITNAPR